MKKLTLAIAIIAFFTLSNNLFSQTRNIPSDADKYPYWIEWMQDETVNFYDVQAAFEVYWKDREITRGCGWKPFKRWESRMQNQIYPDGTRRSASYTFNEIMKYKATHDNIDSPNGDWINLGPFHLPGDNKGYKGLGRINSIAFHPSDPDNIFIGAPAGGLWETEDGGSTWFSNTDDLPTLGVSSIIVNYDNPDIILMGTGDRDAGDAAGMGVFKSTDGGVTWNISNTGMGNRTVGRMIQHPSDPNTIYAASNGGIYISTDLGDNWTDKTTGNFKDIVFKPGDPTTLYAAKGGGFYKSTDSGNTWVETSSGLPGGARGVIGVSNADPEVVYFLLCTSDAYKGIYKSDDSGDTFTEKSTSPNIMSWGCNGGSGGQAWYDLDVAIDPNNASTIFAGGVNCFKSANDGSSWDIVSHWWGDCNVESVHADLHILEWNPVDGKLYAGNDGGIYWTADNGNNWTEITDGLPISQVYRIGQSATDKNLCINGYQDNGTSTYLGNGWVATRGGDGMECVIDHKQQEYSYATVYYGSIVRYYNNSSQGVVAEDGAFGIDESGAWITPFMLDKVDANRMFVGYKNVWRCNNVKATSGQIQWQKISNDLGGSNSSNMSDLEQSFADLNIFYAARSDGSFFRSDNVLDEYPDWVELSSYLPAGDEPSDIAAHPENPDIVYITLQNKVYKSENKGFSWIDISGTLPDINFSSIVYYNNSQEGIYVGSNAGVFYKDASMTDWIWFNTGLPMDASINELEIYYDNDSVSEDVIRAGTYGRGLWSSDMYAGNLSADFTADQTTVPPGCGVNFTDLSLGVPHEWEWTFEGGNPASSTDKNPQNIVFDQAGTYSVTLEVTNPNGNDEIIKNQYITVADDIMPIAEFTASDLITCSNEIIYFEDQSEYCPNYWEWTFEPNYVFFQQGTDANSQNPVVQFAQSGVYSVTLYVENNNGSNSITKTDYIIYGGYSLPFSEDFEQGFGEKSWEIINPDNEITWAVTEVAGNTPGNQAAWMNFYDYYSLHPKDMMISPPMDFSGMNEVGLYFEHAYAQRQGLVDSLVVYISDDCGENWHRIYTGFPDGNGTFATSPATTEFFAPQTAEDWCGNGWGANCNIIDLNAYAGSQNVKIKFESTGRFGNNLYIDNIMISNTVGVAEVLNSDNDFFSVYPNPSDGRISLIFTESSEKANCKILNFQGQLIMGNTYTNINSGQAQYFDLTGFPMGVYILKVETGEKVFTERVIIR